MFLKCCGSSSAGNSYALVASSGEILAIEAGCKMADFKQMIDWRISDVVGCLVSHEHGDHAKYIKDFIKAGIPVYSAFQTQSALEIITGERTSPIPPLKRFQIGNFTVTPFNVPHDADIECYGYLIEHKEIGKLLFLTDLEYCKYNFRSQSINHIMVEANYDIQYVDKNIPNYEHTLRGHMNIETTLNFILTNDNSALRNVVLIHLSDKNGNPVEFQQKTEKILKSDASVYVAGMGLEVNLDLCPF